MASREDASVPTDAYATCAVCGQEHRVRGHFLGIPIIPCPLMPEDKMWVGSPAQTALSEVTNDGH